MRRLKHSFAALSLAFVPALISGAAMVTLSSCEGAAEDAGEAVDDAVDGAADAVDDTVDAVEDATDG